MLSEPVPIAITLPKRSLMMFSLLARPLVSEPRQSVASANMTAPMSANTGWLELFEAYWRKKSLISAYVNSDLLRNLPIRSSMNLLICGTDPAAPTAIRSLTTNILRRILTGMYLGIRSHGITIPFGWEGNRKSVVPLGPRTDSNISPASTGAPALVWNITDNAITPFPMRNLDGRADHRVFPMRRCVYEARAAKPGVRSW